MSVCEMTRAKPGDYCADSPAVRGMIDAYQENRNMAQRGPSGYRIVAIDRRKYVAIDEILTFEGRDCPGQSGRFMVERATGRVFTIRGYGQRGHYIGTVEGLTEQYRAGSATFPEGGSSVHVETGWSRVASVPGGQEPTEQQELTLTTTDHHPAAGSTESTRPTTYRDRRQAKAERLREWADKREAKAAAGHERADQMASVIPFGQPILVGHYSEGRDRRYRDRIWNTMGRAVEDGRKAESMRSRADGIEDQLERSIYSDDPDAIERLRERIAGLEAERERIKAFNKERRGDKLCPCPTDCDCRSLFPRGCKCDKHPLPGYVLSNLNGNIKRNRDRLVVLERQQGRQERSQASGGVSVEDQGHGYVSVTFAEKPARSVLDALKGAGFRWRQGSWWGKADELPEDIGQ